MKLKRLVVTLGLCGVVLCCAAPRAGATIVERVVAVIGDRPVLWTELLRRALSGRIQIRTQTRDPNVVAVQEQEMFRELLDRMIDDRLEEQNADRAHVTVAREEIDRGLANIATQAQSQHGRAVTVDDVLSEVHRRGLTEQDFRDEIRRQILEGKLIELRVRPRVRVTDQDARAAYQHWVQELRDQQPLDVRVLALRIPSMATTDQIAARMTLAQEIARRARAGEDFCELVSRYSDDASTKTSCGSRGPQPLATLLPGIQSLVAATKPGTVSDPLPLVVGQEEVVVLVMPIGQTQIPAFDDVKSDMNQRALLEGLERARKQWLKDLRRNVYIDVRL